MESSYSVVGSSNVFAKPSLAIKFDVKLFLITIDYKV